MNTITLKETLAWIDSGQPFESIRFCTMEGEWVDITEAEKHNWHSPEERKRLEKMQPASRIIKKDPRHYPNCTRNIRILKNGEIRKFKIRLIRKFNGNTVL